MKRFTVLATAIATIALTISGCTKQEKIKVTNRDRTVQFTSIIEKPATRALKNTFEAGDGIGIYMIPDAEDVEGAKNAHYSYVSEGAKFTPAPESEQEALVYPQSGTVDFVAYYPYLAGVEATDTYDIDVTDGVDFLYSNNATGRSAEAAGAVGLLFHHKLTKLVFTVEDSEEGISLEGITANITGMNTVAAFDILTGTMGESSVPADIELTVTGETSTAATMYAIVLPGTYPTYTVEFTLANGQTASYIFESEMTYAEDTQYSYGLEFNPTPVDIIEVDLVNEDIDEWTETERTDLGAIDKTKPVMKISNASDFAKFIADVNGGATDGGKWKNADGEVVIAEDIDMNGVEFVPMALFTGVLNGGGKTISNLNYTSDGAQVGMIAELSGTLKNLTMAANCSFTSTATSGSEVNNGAFVAKLLAGGIVDGCVNRATVTSGISIGGIVGAALSKETATVQNCANYGTVSFPVAVPYGDPNVGGIIGKSETNTVLENCDNYGAVSVGSTGGGKYAIAGGIAGLSSQNIITNCNNKSTASVNINATDYSQAFVGGIAARVFYPNFTDCVNDGAIEVEKVTASGNRVLYVGGIAGSLAGNPTITTSIVNCRNTATIDVESSGVASNNTSPAYLGGIVGFMGSNTNRGLYVDNCRNSGNLSLTFNSTTAGNAVGGIMGLVDMNEGSAQTGIMRNGRVSGCTNTGSVSITPKTTSSGWSHAGGIVGRNARAFATIEGCTNDGNVTSNTDNRISAGGIVGETHGEVRGSTNTGTVSAERHASQDGTIGGIAARVMSAITLSGNINRGNLIHAGGSTGTNAGPGGIVGYLHSGTVDACENYGKLVSYNDENRTYTGAIVCSSAVSGDATISNCKVGGAVGVYDGSAPDKGIGAAAMLTQDNFATYIYAKTTNTTTSTDNTFGN